MFWEIKPLVKISGFFTFIDIDIFTNGQLPGYPLIRLLALVAGLVSAAIPVAEEKRCSNDVLDRKGVEPLCINCCFSVFCD